jgi:deoxycytidine triphosphate deaminase
MNKIVSKIKTIDDIKPGHLPGYFFPKLIELGHLKIEPFSQDSLGNICYYLHFNNLFRKFTNKKEIVDLANPQSIEDSYNLYKEYDEIILKPGESIIGQSYEKIGLSNWLLAKLENTSALGRVFLNHASHGFSHPNHGIDEPHRLMLELTNLSQKNIKIHTAKNINGKIVGTEAMRVYIEKLPYPTEEYKQTISMHKLKMDKEDKS